MFMLSPFQPVFLETHYIQTEEEAEAFIQNYNNEAVEKKQYCRKIKQQLINFVKIELGKQTEILFSAYISEVRQRSTPNVYNYWPNNLSLHARKKKITKQKMERIFETPLQIDFFFNQSI